MYITDMKSLVFGIIIFLADQLIKGHVRKNKIKDGKTYLWETVKIKRAYNSGLAMNKLEDDPKRVLVINSVIFGGVLFNYFESLIYSNRLKRFGLSTVLGGAASNLYDRVKYSKVTDYAILKFLPQAIVNLGDIAIVVGSIITVVSGLWNKKD